MSKSKELKDIIEVTKEKMIPEFEEMFNISLDYKTLSLGILEDTFNEVFPEGREPSSPMTFVPFGVYLGECIVENFDDAKWHHNEGEAINEAYIEIDYGEDKGAVLYPFRRVEKFWYDRSDGLLAFYQMVKMMTEKDVDDMVEESDGEWTELPNGMKYRMTTIDRGEE